MLDLKSSHWAEISASCGGSGTLTAELLIRLSEGYDQEALAELYHQICHQNSVGETAYVAAPHLTAIAFKTADLRFKAWLLQIVGLVVASAQRYARDAPPIRAEWIEEFDQTCADARQMAAELLARPNLDSEVSFLLVSTLAALHGHSNLTLLMQDGLDLSCPECGEYIKFGD